MPDWVTFVVTNGGAIAVLGVAWWIERQRSETERNDRIAIQKAYDLRRDATEERIITALVSATTAIREAIDSQQALKASVSELKNTLVSIITGRKE